jgi:hypothetical protein
MAAPADAVVLQRAAHAVIGQDAELQIDAAARAEALRDERPELAGAAMFVTRTEGTANVPIRREGAHHRLDITGGKPGQEAPDDVAGAGAGRLEYRGPHVAFLVDRPLSAVGAEHHRPVVRGLGDHRYRPCQLPPGVVHVRQQLHHRPPVRDGGPHGLGAGMETGQPGQVAAHEVPYRPAAADLSGPRVVDHHLPRPHRLKGMNVTAVQRGKVLRDWISLASGAGLAAYQLHGAGEIREPGHPIPLRRR